MTCCLKCSGRKLGGVCLAPHCQCHGEVEPQYKKDSSSWEERFDEKFKTEGYKLYQRPQIAEEIKSFIRELLKEVEQSAYKIGRMHAEHEAEEERRGAIQAESRRIREIVEERIEQLARIKPQNAHERDGLRERRNELRELLEALNENN